MTRVAPGTVGWARSDGPDSDHVSHWSWFVIFESNQNINLWTHLFILEARVTFIIEFIITARDLHRSRYLSALNEDDVQEKWWGSYFPHFWSNYCKCCGWCGILQSLLVKYSAKFYAPMQQINEKLYGLLRVNLFYIWCECNQSYLLFKSYNMKWWRLESGQMLNGIDMGSSNTTISFVCGFLLWGRETSAGHWFGHSVPDRDAPIWILKESVSRCHSYRSVRSENWTVVQLLPVLAIVWLFSWEFPKMRSQSDHQ